MARKINKKGTKKVKPSDYPDIPGKIREIQLFPGENPRGTTKKKAQNMPVFDMDNDNVV